jgi:hypothetical protein
MMITGIFWGKLTPDAHQLWEVAKKRWEGFRKPTGE